MMMVRMLIIASEDARFSLLFPSLLSNDHDGWLHLHSITPVVDYIHITREFLLRKMQSYHHDVCVHTHQLGTTRMPPRDAAMPWWWWATRHFDEVSSWCHSHHQQTRHLSFPLLLSHFYLLLSCSLHSAFFLLIQMIQHLPIILLSNPRYYPSLDSKTQIHWRKVIYEILINARTEDFSGILFHKNIN